MLNERSQSSKIVTYCMWWLETGTQFLQLLSRGNSLFIPPLNISCCYDLLWPTECEGNDTVWLLSTEPQRLAALTLLENGCHVTKPRLPCWTRVIQLTVNKNQQTFIWALLDHKTQLSCQMTAAIRMTQGGTNRRTAQLSLSQTGDTKNYEQVERCLF